jgi:hypothetical protein
MLVFDLEGPPTSESPTPVVLHPPELPGESRPAEAEPEFRGIPTDLEPPPDDPTKD